MKKIPTIFARDMARKGHPIEADVYRVDPLLLARATATVKWDGTAVELDEAGRWWVRHVCGTTKTHHVWPPGFRFVHHDEVTNRDVGWVPVDFDDPAHEVIADAILSPLNYRTLPGTYEAMGPERGLFDAAHLIRHDGGSMELQPPPPIDYDGLRAWFEEWPLFEGIVWWLDGEPIGKVKRFDLGLPWPAPFSVGEQGSTVSTRSPSPADLTLPPGPVGSPTEARTTHARTTHAEWGTASATYSFCATRTEWVE